ncbi:uncharacterized protein LOC125241358 isoform X2 [Leguminivora glycinivorella]|uniref:uncharacterized protein LOC125241358 isoform X2 n=1 Tax=Leguminivora glycinivorella TaxID=1035111 RepID=UPI00200EC0C4|nr:uncharacterized protein LOC125241358 isoform X2 [Leguminivora glycinivorella]
MKEAVTKKQIQATKRQSYVPPTKEQVSQKQPLSREVSKVSSKSNLRYSKSINTKTSKITQPLRRTRFASTPTIIKENSVMIPQKRKVYIPPYLEKMSKKQQVSQKSSIIQTKSDSMSNLLNVNNEQITLEPSQSKVDDLLSTLLKVSMKPAKDLNYVVYRNEMETSHCSTAVENIPVTAGPSSNEDVLRRKLSNLSNNDSAYSSNNSASIALNPVITNHQPFQSNRKTSIIKPIKSNISRKGTNTKMVSRIKKLANLMFSKKSPTNIHENLSKRSIIPQNCSKMYLKVDLLVDDEENNESSEESSMSSATKHFLESLESENRPSPKDQNDGGTKQDSKTTLVVDYSESNTQPEPGSKPESSLECNAKSEPQALNTTNVITSSDKMSLKILDSDMLSKAMDITNESIADSCNDILVGISKAVDITNESITDNCNDILDEMRELLEECLNFNVTPEADLNKVSEDADIIASDIENVTPIGSETYETSSSFYRTYDAGSMISLTRSFTDFSHKSLPSRSKTSEVLTDESWYNIAPSRPESEILSENKDTISVTQKPKAGHAFSSFSVNAQPSPFRQQPDYVNLVDSETGSVAQAGRRATSEEVLMSGRSSESYVSCAVEEEASIPSWLYNLSQQPSGSFSSSRHAVLPEVVPERDFDVNGNELTVHGAGAGDGCGIHSDQSQDSSGQGTSFSSTTSSTAQSESIAVDPGSFLADYSPPGERAHALEMAPPDESIETLDVENSESQSRPTNRNRNPRGAHRVSLPASDADVSSIDTDVPSD